MYRWCSIIILIVFTVMADDFPFNFGFSGGLNIASMAGTEIDAIELEYGSTSSTFSGNGGIRMGYSFNGWLELETGLQFSGNGYEILLESEDAGVDWSSGMPRDVDINYYRVRKVTFMEFPVSLRFQTPYSSEMMARFYGFGGIRPGLIVSAIDKIIGEIVTSNFPDPGESTEREDLLEEDLMKSSTSTDSLGRTLHYTFDDFYRRGNISIQLGLGFEKRYQNVGFFVQGQYVWGLLNFNKLSDEARRELAQFNADESGSDVVFLGEPEALFRSMQFSAGLNIFIPKE